jgi:hypothetical protein
MVLATVAVPFTSIEPAYANSKYPGNGYYYDYASGGVTLRNIHYDGPKAKQSDWMAWVDDDTNLAKLSIPGTHDSMSAHGGETTVTQGLCGSSGPGDYTPCDLTEQLESGIRFFDIRVSCVKDFVDPNTSKKYDGEQLLIFHGHVFQFATLSDVLSKVKGFLTKHPTETVLMRVARERNHWADESVYDCDAAGDGYGSNVERLFKTKYYDAYASLFWNNNGTLPGPAAVVPRLGDAGVRGRVVLLEHFGRAKHYGVGWDEVIDWTKNNWERDVDATWQLKAHWETTRDEGLDVVNKGITRGYTTLYHTFLGGSKGLWPNTVAFGDGVSYPGVNYYALNYIVDGEVSNVGILSSDFPGAGLINATIGLNLKYADSDKINLVQQYSFDDIVEKILPSVAEGSDGALTRTCGMVTCPGQATGYFDVAWPNENWHASTLKDGSGTWLIEHDGLRGTGTADGYITTVWNGDYASEVSNEEVRSWVDKALGDVTSGTVGERATILQQRLKARYPGQLWMVIAKKADHGWSDSSTEGFTYYWQYHKRVWHDVAYYVAGYSPGTVTGTLTSSSPTISKGSPVTYTATFMPDQLCRNGGSCRGTPSGFVAFKDRGVDIAGCTSQRVKPNADGSPTATCTLTYTEADRGLHYIDAYYFGDGYTPAYAAPQLVQRVLNPVSVLITGYQVYGDTSPDLDHSTATPQGVQVEGTLTCTGTTGGAINNTLSAGQYKVDAASCSGLRLTGPSAADYDLVYVGRTFSVALAQLEVTASSGAMTYGGTPPTITPSYSGFVNGENESVLKTAPTCTTEATSSSGVGTYSSDCQGATADNYNVRRRLGQVTVSPAALTVQADHVWSVYGEDVPKVGAAYGGFVNGENESVLTQFPTCTSAASKSSGAGVYATSCTGATAANYTITHVEGTHTVERAPLTVTASSPTMTYGNATPTVTPTYEGFVLSEDPDDLDVAPTCSTTADNSTQAGATPATTCSGGVSDNYEFTYVDGAVTVRKGALHVTASSPTAPYGSTPSVSPLYSGFVNGEGASVLDTAPTCTTTATARSGVGSYDTTCAGAADDNYEPSYAGGTYTVTPAPLTVTAPDATSVYGQEAPSVTPVYNGFVNGEDASVLESRATCSTEATSASHVGTYVITCSGAGGANYGASYVDGLLTVTPAPLSVVADDKTRPYDEDTPPFTYHLTGFVNGDTAAAVTGSPDLTTPADRLAPVGSYPIEVSVGTLGARDYRFVPVAGTLELIRATTRMVAESADFSARDDAPYGSVSARLTYGSADKPVVGERVTFTSGTTTLCMAETDSTGLARCPFTNRQQRPLIARDGFTASYDGAHNFSPSSADGTIRR